MDKRLTGIPQPEDATRQEGTGDAANRTLGRPEDQVLSTDARAWLSGLPDKVRPEQLAKGYPRICNRLAEHWPAPELVIPILNDLLVDGRGDRQGFALSLIMELTTLKKHFVATYAAEKPDIWDSTPGLY
jgi:hypothetical protein